MQMISIEEIPVERIDEFWDIHIQYLVDDGIIAYGGSQWPLLRL